MEKKPTKAEFFTHFNADTGEAYQTVRFEGDEETKKVLHIDNNDVLTLFGPFGEVLLTLPGSVSWDTPEIDEALDNAWQQEHFAYGVKLSFINSMARIKQQLEARQRGEDDDEAPQVVRPTLQ